jgi:DNA-binding response OmpR family regulator
VTGGTLNILVIDDNQVLLETLAAGLETNGFAVTTALTGREGLAKTIEKHPDLVVLDIRLPDIDGFQVCAEVRKNAATADIPVIMITGDRTVDIDKGFAIGADDCIMKPIEMDYLVGRIRKLTSHRPRILIVDDDRQLSDMLAKVLASRKYEPVVLNEGTEVIQVIKEKKPELALLDISLPLGPDGVEMCRMIKRNPETKHVPVIMLTANEYVDLVEKCFDLGAEDYLFKPFNLTDLMLRVRKYIRSTEEK